MSFSVRKGQASDVARLLEVWRRAVAATHDFLAPDDRDAIEPIVAREYLPNADLLVAADEDDRAVAFLGGTGREIDSLFVDPQVHGHGVGTMLMDAFDALGTGELTVEVNEQNDAARRFYERRGFRVVQRFPDDRQGRPYPLLRMVR
jgi:putative acetyltransferase